MDYDIVIVGAGPSGLSAAIRLSQLASQHECPLRICILEKGSEVGSHLLSGAALDPRALNELIPEWQGLDPPPFVKATQDKFWLLREKFHIPLPTPPQLRNNGNYLLSLGQLCRWLAKQAEMNGVDIFPGFAAKQASYNEQGCVQGVITHEVGINKLGERTNQFVPGMIIRGAYTLIAEGCRGSLTKELSERFKLRDKKNHQTYAIGVKELWKIEASQHQLGRVIHTLGWPLDWRTYGGSFIYHMAEEQLAVGFVVGLDYENPYLDPYEELQRFKQHPSLRSLFINGERLCYGARALNEGGYQSIPQLTFPGGLLIGCAAGFLDVPRIKGIHNAMKSGMLAAELVFKEFQTRKQNESLNLTSSLSQQSLSTMNSLIEESWIGKELKLARNIRPGFRYGLWAGLMYATLDTFLFRGRAPWTFRHRVDHLCLKKANQVKPIQYPKHDGKISFDKLTSLQFSHVHHDENQPPHLILKNKKVAITINYDLYNSPEQRYCPALVYEIVFDELKNPYLQINASNCIHCKTCDIKDPTQNITWMPPMGGGGPNYMNM